MNSLSIVIPVFNEEEILKDRIKYLIPELKQIFQNIDIILSENGSTDRTKEIIKQLASDWEEVCAIVDDGVADYGQALINGINLSKCEKVSILELDYLDLEFIKRSYNLLSEYDLIIGSKKISKKIDRRSWKRKFFSWSYNFILRILFRLKLTETHGLKTFKKSKMNRIINSCITRQAVFPSELVIRAHRSKDIKICEIPLSLPLVEIRSTRISASKRLMKTIYDIILLWRALKVRN